MPRSIREGEEVLAGMIVQGQAVRIQVNRPYEQSALARILALVKDASERKAPAELFIRRFARIYTPIVILLSFLIVSVPALVGMVTPSFQYVFSDWFIGDWFSWLMPKYRTVPRLPIKRHPKAHVRRASPRSGRFVLGSIPRP